MGDSFIYADATNFTRLLPCDRIGGMENTTLRKWNFYAFLTPKGHVAMMEDPSLAKPEWRLAFECSFYGDDLPPPKTPFSFIINDVFDEMAKNDIVNVSICKDESALVPPFHIVERGGPVTIVDYSGYPHKVINILARHAYTWTDCRMPASIICHGCTLPIGSEEDGHNLAHKDS